MYWPFVVMVVTTIGTIVSGIWGAYVTFRAKRIEQEQTDSQKRFELQCEQMKLDFERQKDFQQDLIDECKNLRLECQELRAANQALVGSVMERDAKIRHQEEEIASLRREIVELKSEVDRLTRHVAAIESDRERLRKNCPVSDGGP